jgi:hypothetical protein
LPELSGAKPLDEPGVARVVVEPLVEFPVVELLGADVVTAV